MNQKHKAGQQTIALTGATGFIGPFLLKAFINAGFHVQALTRRAQPPQTGVTWIEGDLFDEHALNKLLDNADMVVHAAGAIKAKNKSQFFAVNEEATRQLAELCHRREIIRFVLISSLAAREPQLSPYAASKAAAENAMKTQLDGTVPWVVLRPPAVYGPGDAETLKIFKAVKSGFAPLLNTQATASWIHAEDLAQATLAALTDAEPISQILSLDDGSGGYFIRDVYHMIGKLLEKRVHIIPFPPVALKLLGALNEVLSNITGHVPMLTRAKARELSHLNWSVNKPTLDDTSKWSAKIPLEQGLESALIWYKEKNLL